MIVETFLDPTRNPRAPAENDRRRRDIAGIVQEVVDREILEHFVNGVREHDEARVREAGKRIATRVALHPRRGVEELAAILRAGLDEPYDFGVVHPDAPERAERPAPNIHGFLPMVFNLDAYAAKSREPIELVSDEDSIFGDVLDFVLGFARNPETAAYFEEFGVEGPVRHVVGRRQVKSEDSLPVQIADLCAGLCRSRMASFLKGERIAGELEVAWTALAPSVERGTTIHHRWVSDGLLAKMRF